MSKASPDWTLIETYPLNFLSIKKVLIAPTHSSIGIGIFSDDIFLSLKINWVAPCLTAISASFWILWIAIVKFSLLENVQSIDKEFFPKKFINLLNWELDNIGLFKT